MKLQLPLLAIAFLFSGTAFSQNCGCSQCNIPIIADYSRSLKLEVIGAQFDNLSTNGQGVCEVEIDFAHDFIADLQISLTSPSGQTVPLVLVTNFMDKSNFSRWNIKFKRCGDPVIPDPGFSPQFDANTNWPDKTFFTGSYYPATGACLDWFNSGTVNGTWLLNVTSNGYRGVGFIYGFKINFCKPAGIQCDGLNYDIVAGEDCATASPLPLNVSEFVGNTAPYAQGFSPGFCGFNDNDQWFSFVPSCDTIGFKITPGYCINGDGIQIALYQDCYTPVPGACNVGCEFCGWNSETIIAAVTPGQQYFILIDGWSGDQCDFIFEIPPSCLGGLSDPDTHDIHLDGCQGTTQGISLTNIPFGAAGYIWKATNGALVNGQTQVIVAGPENLSVELTYGNGPGEVCVAAYNFTDTTDFFCEPFTADTNLFLIENATVCYTDLPFISEYVDYGVPPYFFPGVHQVALHDYVDDDGETYPCPVTLQVNLTVEGAFSQLPSIMSLGPSYTLPNGDLVTESGIVAWSDTLPSGCTNDHTQGIFLVDYLYNSDGCAPDTVTYFISGPGFLECQGGFPAFISGSGAHTVVYQNTGVYDLIGHLGSTSFVFADTIKINVAPLPVLNFNASLAQNILTLTNLSQNATDFLWDFGDGTTSAELNPVHTYAAPGNYTVTLSSVGGCPGNPKSKIITITGQLPVAAFLNSETAGCSPLAIQFTDASIGAPFAWAWEFPGGNPSSATFQNPVVSYLIPGTYPVTLSIENAFGQNTVVQNMVITILPPASADFTVMALQNEISLTNLSQNATNYLWDFGDGTTSTDFEPNHVYQNPGEYTVTLQANGPCGSEVSTQTISISGQAPQAVFQASPNEGCIPMMVQFEDQSIGTPTSWVWDFPGGIPGSSTEQNPSVLYISSGIFDVSLTVQNAFGQSTISQTALISTGPLPAVAFNKSITDLEVVFENLSQDADSYVWDFGDGSGSMEANPSHTYALPGDYLVTLQAINTCGNSILQLWVTVLTSGATSPESIRLLRVLPNPSEGYFQLELKDEPAAQCSWYLFNSLGQNLSKRELGAFEGYYLGELDLSQLPSAVYWLEVRAGFKRSWVRLVVE